ncbi:MAG: copper chaperone PCu(A)C [Variovorax sp.]|nr:MAG: copper chaperone PCu(A)C [Variovorax sp.]
MNFASFRAFSAFRSTALAFAACASLGAQAQVTVKDAWVRATVPQQKSTTAYFQASAGTDSRLVSVTTTLTPVAELHEMAMSDGVMRMRKLDGGIALPAGKTIELKPSGQHVMLMDLAQQVKVGDKVPLTLVFEDRNGKRETQQVEATVRPLGGAAAPGAAMPAMPGMHGDHKH